ncbi:MAG: hypothetical protein RLZZ299_925 [Pseudomonadota bacterium]
MGRTLLVGDVHGCAGPLARLLAEVRPDRVILLGDLFAKGPDPRGTWELIVAHRAEAVLGNHDARMLKVWDTPGDSPHHAACRALPQEARAWIDALPLFLHGTCAGRPWLGVHAGVDPDAGWAGTAYRTALVVRRWPDDQDLSHPFWWERWRGPEHVYYGHDAMRGVQIHPHSTGLDSGCVYGGPLSGWILEEGRLVQVPGWSPTVG